MGPVPGEAGPIGMPAAWYYPEPSSAATEVEDRIAFWRGVRVET